MTHDYKRNGTVDLFVALNIGTGEVLHQTRKKHTANDVLAFFKWIDAHVPRYLDIHAVLDNLSAHSAPPVAEWLAHPNRERCHLHFTPTSASWLNLVEGWFAQLTSRRLRHGTFDSVTALEDASALHGRGSGDLLDADDRLQIQADVADRLAFLAYAPVLKVSALSGKNAVRILPALRQAEEAYHARVPTAALNRLLQEAQQQHPPPPVRRRNG